MSRLSQERSEIAPVGVVRPTAMDRGLVLLLRLGAFACFAGWTWGHLYWEAPYGILLWQPSTYELADRFGVSWEEFVGTGDDDGLIQKVISRIGWLYLACAVLSLTAGPGRRWSWIPMAGLLGGCGLLTVLSYAKYVSAQRQLPMFVEHGGQMLMPVLLVVAITLGVRHRATVVLAMLAFIATFAGHGSYAIGFWPTPATFFAMTSLILDVPYETAKKLLWIAGVLDFVVCVGILIPQLRRGSALYATVWGFLTAMARPVAGMSWGLNYWGADQFVHEAVLRAPHFIIALFLFLLWRNAPQQNARPTEPTSLKPTAKETS